MLTANVGGLISKDMKDRILRALQTFKGFLLASDKWLHLSVGFVIAYFAGFLSPILGFVLGVLIGAGKEIYDLVNKRGHAELWDFFFTVVGVLSGLFCLWIARLLFHVIS